MAERIQTAGVIGAGVMGSAIAAHFAGAGIRTHLLDIVPPNLKPEEQANPAARNRFADGGLEKALKAKPAAFFTPDAARLITTGNLEDHLSRLGECDLIVEAVVEDLGIKQKLFEKIAPFLRPTAILASNTSGLSIASMSAVLPQELKSRFLVLHFFNPVRYMRLLEVAQAPETDPAVMRRMTEFGEFLGKGVIDAKDTPNFVANRIGVYSMMLTMHQMLESGLSIEAVDKITGKPMGRPSSAAFGTGDLVGIDTLVHVAKNCFDSLTEDEARSTFEERTECKGNEQQLQASVLRDAGDRILQDLERTVLLGELMQEDDVEHDPADGHQPGEAAEKRRFCRHFRRHAIGDDGNQDGGEQAGPGSDVCLEVKKTETDQHDDNRYGSDQRR